MSIKKIILIIIAVLLLSGFISSKLSVKSGFTVSATEMQTFKRLLDFEAIPQWNSTVLSSKKIEAGEVKIGSGFIQVRKGFFGTSEMKFTVLDLIFGKLLKVEGHTGKKTILFEYTISRIGNQTKVDLILTESDIPLPLSILLKPIYQGNVDKNMMKLKQLVQVESD